MAPPVRPDGGLTAVLTAVLPSRLQIRDSRLAWPDLGLRVAAHGPVTSVQRSGDRTSTIPDVTWRPGGNPALRPATQLTRRNPECLSVGLAPTSVRIVTAP